MGLLEKTKRLWRHKSTLWDMSIRQLRAKYSGSLLGLWWAVAIPLVLAASINFIFTNVFKVGMKDFTLFVLSGIIPWLFFSNALCEVTNSFVVQRTELKQNIFPRELVPFSSIIANFLNYMIGFLFLLPVFLIAHPKIGLVLPFLFVITGLYFFFILGLGILFSVLNLFFRDLSHLLSIGMMIWFWVTPVFYSLEMLSFPYRWICLLNPVSHYIMAYQKILFEGLAPSLQSLGIAFSEAIFFLVIGYVFFLRKEAELLKRI